MSSKVLLLYGSGPNVGLAILNKFSSNGWKTAAAVRTMKPEYEGTADVVLKCDFGDLKSIEKIYGEVESKLGTPSCVIYNAYAMETFNNDMSNPFAPSAEAYARDLVINTTSCYTAARLAALGFAKLPSGPKTFIYTGNPFATSIQAEQPGLASGKAASAYLIETASIVFKDSQWYYADQRMATGRSVMNRIDGEAHGETYYVLATSEKQLAWNYTFVKDVGYIKFPDVIDRKYVPISELFAEANK